VIVTVFNISTMNSGMFTQHMKNECKACHPVTSNTSRKTVKGSLSASRSSGHCVTSWRSLNARPLTQGRPVTINAVLKGGARQATMHANAKTRVYVEAEHLIRNSTFLLLQVTTLNEHQVCRALQVDHPDTSHTIVL
jgi:hypothetical protein